jgi:hypothetical protein
MRVLLLAFVTAALASSGLAAPVETWRNVPLVDAMCANQVKSNPDAHTAECALNCGASGMGLLTSDGTFLKFDDAGTKQALAAIKASKKKDHIRATVTGERSGAKVKVQSLKLD